MGAAAQVHPGALPVEADLLAPGQVLDDLHLVVLAHIAKLLDGFLAAEHHTLYRQVLLRQLLHALLDRVEVFRGKVVAGGEIVVEAVLDHRADSDLHPGKQLLHRHGQQVGGGVADDFQARLIPLGNNREGWRPAR